MKVRVCHTLALSVCLASPALSAQGLAAPTLTIAQEAPQGRRAGQSWLTPTLHVAGLFAAQRVGASILWAEAFSFDNPQRVGRQWARAFTEPPKFDPDRRPFEWDGDWWVINVVGHGLMGAESYLRARQCEHSVWASLLFTAGASAVWEYVFEAPHVRPSANDLVLTPLIGLGLGELRYQAYRHAHRLGRVGGAALRGLVDPFGSLERALGAGC